MLPLIYKNNNQIKGVFMKKSAYIISLIIILVICYIFVNFFSLINGLVILPRKN